MDVFVNKISLQPHLYNSAEFQSFIKSTMRFKFAILDFSPKTNFQIAKDFQIVFSEFLSTQTTKTEENEILSSLEYFNNALASFEALKTLCNENVEAFNDYGSGMEDLVISLKEINEFYSEFYESKTFDIKKKNSFINPFMILLDWTQAEILDLKAIIEAIESRENIIKLLKKVSKRYENEARVLNELKNGKKNKFSLVSNKNLTEQQQTVENLQNEKNSLETIQKISTCQLVYKEIFMFKQKKVHKDEVILRTFASAGIEEFNSLMSQVCETDNIEDD